MKYVSIDLETTGLDENYCQVLEFAAIIDDTADQRSIERLPYFHCYVMHEVYVGQPYALSMHPKIFTKLANGDDSHVFLEPKNVGYEFSKFLESNGFELGEKITAAGKNFARFDAKFLDRLPDFNNHVNIHHRVVDPAMFFVRPDDECLPGSNECLKRAGIDKEVAHTAMEDAADVISLVRIGFNKLWQ